MDVLLELLLGLVRRREDNLEVLPLLLHVFSVPVGVGVGVRVGVRVRVRVGVKVRARVRARLRVRGTR